MEQGEVKLTLVEKLYNIMSELDYIQKDKKNTFHGYTYASEAAIKNAVHSALAKYRVMFFPTGSEVLSVERGFGAKQDENMTTVRLSYAFINVDNPQEKLEGTFQGTGSDKGDKGAYKAITGALKYALTSTFLIETGDDPEKDERMPEPQAPANPKSGHWTDGKQKFNKEESELAKAEAQAIAARKIQEIRPFSESAAEAEKREQQKRGEAIAAAGKPERPAALQLALDRIKDQKTGIEVLNDWIFELGNEVDPDAVLRFHNFYKQRFGIKSSTEMNVEQLRQCVELIWRKIEDHKRGNPAPQPMPQPEKAGDILQELVKELPLGVGADSPAWIDKPSQAAKDGIDAHNSYIEVEQKKRGRR